MTKILKSLNLKSKNPAAACSVELQACNQQPAGAGPAGSWWPAGGWVLWPGGVAAWGLASGPADVALSPGRLGAPSGRREAG